MFKRLASDALGLSDIGAVIRPADYDKVEADDYVMHEDGEKIFFLIKSKTDEYCFTNKALIHVDGTSAMSKKRTLRRFDYAHYPVSQVALETAGTMDMDIEIKFSMGDHHYSIDVNKKHMEELKDLYKALIKIGSLQKSNAQYFIYAEKSLEIAAQTVNRSTAATTTDEQFKAVNQYTFAWLKDAYESYQPKDFGWVFEKFIKS
jgi:Bacterial PH domain/YvbH-like oligomerisation region